MGENNLKSKIYVKPKLQVLLFQNNDDICAPSDLGDNDYNVGEWDDE